MSDLPVLPTPAALLDVRHVLNQVSQEQIANLLVEEYRERLRVKAVALSELRAEKIEEVQLLLELVYQRVFDQVYPEVLATTRRVHKSWGAPLRTLFKKARVANVPKPAQVSANGEFFSFTVTGESGEEEEEEEELVNPLVVNGNRGRRNPRMSRVPSKVLRGLTKAVLSVLCELTNRPWTDYSDNEGRPIHTKWIAYAAFGGVQDDYTFPVGVFNVEALVQAVPEVAALVEATAAVSELWRQREACVVKDEALPQLQRTVMARMTAQILGDAGVALDRGLILDSLGVKP